MQAMDCTDIRALLSGIVDGELETNVQHAAERHLADCDECRSLIDEAEQLDALILDDATSIAGSAHLPKGFETRVLARTTRAGADAYARRWTTWAGWIAAAACLAMAVSIWVMDRRDGVRGLSPTGSGVMAATLDYDAYDTGQRLRSLPAELGDVVVLEADLPDMAGLGYLNLGGIAPLAPTRDEADALLMASILIGMLVDTESDADDGAFESYRQAIAYDGLPTRLERMTAHMSAEDSRVISAAGSILEKASTGSLDDNDLVLIREWSSSLDLVSELDRLSSLGGASEL